MNITDLKYATCSSPHDPTIGAHVGVQIKHTPSGVVVSNVTEKLRMRTN